MADRFVTIDTTTGELPAPVEQRIVTAPRRFVVFGDSWTTTLDGVNIPAVAIASVGGTVVKNHGVAGAFLGPTTYGSDPTKATQAQVNAANADTSYGKGSISDVLLLVGVNNIGGFLPTVPEALSHFNAIKALYPRARFWYAANSKKAINNSGSNDPWRWYNRFFEAATLAGFEAASFSPMWNWGARRDVDLWWPAGSVDTNVHMAAAGQNAYAKRLAAFLSGGDSWRPFFKVPMSLHSNAQSLLTAQGVAGTAAIGNDSSYVDGSVLRLRVAISGMDALAAVDTGTYQAILQIPTAYIPSPNTYAHYPAACRTGSGTMDFTYAFRVDTSPAGVVSVDPRLLNNHAGYFELNADIALNRVQTAD